MLGFELSRRARDDLVEIGVYGAERGVTNGRNGGKSQRGEHAARKVGVHHERRDDATTAARAGQNVLRERRARAVAAQSLAGAAPAPTRDCAVRNGACR